MHIELKVPLSIPTAYFDGWFEVVETTPTHRIIRSTRIGDTAKSDVQYIIDRCASGLHFGIEEVKGEHDGHDIWPLISRPGIIWCRDCQVHSPPDEGEDIDLNDEIEQLH